ncbi:hypothetical protein [Micromonospora chalcea]|uniref:hypothetical protein n=1 Tax=Micromonospora chalcea TaxID=1874 RepID=UPI0037C5A158
MLSRIAASIPSRHVDGLCHRLVNPPFKAGESLVDAPGRAGRAEHLLDLTGQPEPSGSLPRRRRHRQQIAAAVVARSAASSPTWHSGVDTSNSRLGAPTVVASHLIE